MSEQTTGHKERIREFDIARAFAIVVMVAVHSEYAIYDYGTPWFGTLIDYLGSPFAAPTFMFILGANVFLSSKNSPKQLFARGLSLFGISLIFNVICHALPFFILGYVNQDLTYTASGFLWIFASDILTFSALAFMFFAAVKKFKLNNFVLVVIGVAASVLNIILTYNVPMDYSNNVILAAVTSLFYNSSSTGYFAFLGWIIFPIAGYLFVQILTTVKNKDRFYVKVGGIGLLVYLACIVISYVLLPNLPFIEFTEEYSYYQMHPFNAFGTIAFCLAWLALMHFLGKVLPRSLDKHIARWNKNLTNIYVIQWFLINYFFVVASNGILSVNEWQFVLCSIVVIVASDFLAWLFVKYKAWAKKA